MNLIALLLVTLVLRLNKSQAIDPQYEACKPFVCGGVNISYPFFVPHKQPSYCGFEAFNVSCSTKNQAIIRLSDDDYIINSISYQNMSVNITNSAFSSSVFRCPSSIHNLSFEYDGRFNFTSKPRGNIIVLLQNCSSNKNLAKIGCSDHDALWAVYEDDFHGDNLGVCGREVLVPYDNQTSTSTSTSSSIEGILRRGFVLKYLSNNCTNCVDTGGRCGFNTSTLEFLCFCPDKPHNSTCHLHNNRVNNGENWKIILASVLSVSVLIILLLLIFCWRQRSGQSSTPGSIAMSFNRARSGLLEVGSMEGVTVFSYRELEEATHGFDPKRELGEGGFGIVYYGKLRDGREVAVKRLYEKNYNRIEQFNNEIKILTDLRHPNLVTLHGCCTTRHSRELLLVYEYIANGTVADNLHGGQTKPSLLPWSTRMRIAIETATALSYLHSSDIIHRDVKTNNILLDSNLSVKVADFGLSRLFPADVTHISTAPQGTPGYLDPEYHQCYHLTDKSDVYSFGVVLVELISSLPAVDVGRHRHEINLSNYAMTRIQRSAFSELVDPDLGFETDSKVRRMTTLVAELAFRCLQHWRELRPSMEEVLEVLCGILSMDYDALEAEQVNTSTGRTHIMIKPPPSPTGDDDVTLLRNTGQRPPSPVSVMDKWLNSSKSTTPITSRSS